MASSARKTERLLDLLATLLSAARPLTYAEIREQFDDYRTKNPASGIRTFERDKAELLLLGVPLRCIKRSEASDDVEEDAYVVDRDRYLLPEISLEADERAALGVTAEVMRAQPGFPYRTELDSALRKIAFDSGPSKSSSPQEVSLNLPVERGSPRTTSVLLRQLESAVRARKRVTASYRKLGAATAESRTLEPYGLVYRHSAWLLIAKSIERDEIRTFRVDRFTRVRIGPRPSEPDFDRPSLDLAAFARRSPWTFAVAAPLDVELRIDADAAWIASEDFGPDARNEPQMDGSIRVRFSCANPDYVTRRVLGEGGKLEIVAPPVLRQRVRVAAERAVAAYEPPKAPGKVKRA